MQYVKIGRNLYRPMPAYQKPNVIELPGIQNTPKTRTFVSHYKANHYEILNIGIYKSRIDIRI